LGEAWFTGFADELSRCLVDAEKCADTCEAYIDDATLDGEELRRAVHILAAPAAISRVLIDLIDHPPPLVLAAVRLCRDLTATAADELQGPPNVVDALRTASASAAALLEAAG
jgi:hypothetical protein